MGPGRAENEAYGEEEGPRPQRAPRPPSLLSFLRGGSAGRRRWRRRRETDFGEPSGAEQRMWLMGEDGSEEDDEDERYGGPKEGSVRIEVPTTRQQHSAGVTAEDPPASGNEHGSSALDVALDASRNPTDSADPDKGWSVLLPKAGGVGRGDGEGAMGDGGLRSGGRCRRWAKMVASGLSGPWAFGVFAVTGQIAGEVSGPCAVASLAIAAVAAIFAAFCKAELEDNEETPRSEPKDYTAAPTSSAPSSNSDSHSEEDVDGGSTAPRSSAPSSSTTPLTPRRRPPNTKRSLSCGWASVLGHAATVAAACRALSASMDYITGGRVRRVSEESFGFLPAVLGASSPDVLAVGVAALPTALFVLGLEPWSGLRNMLNVVVTLSVIFFVGAGSLETDPGNWKHGFIPAGFSGLVSGSAMSTLGFVGFHAVLAEGRRERILGRGGIGRGGIVFGRRKMQQRNASKGASNAYSITVASTISLLIAFASYFAIATVLTMMVQFRSLSAGTPLVQAFEVRDVDLARLVMAALGIAALALALVEASPPLHRAIVSLSAHDGLLPRHLARENPRTSTPALAIICAGLLTSVLALLGDPLALLRLSSAAPLMAHALSAVDLMHRRYQPVNREEQLSDCAGGKNNHRSKSKNLREEQVKISVKTLRQGLAFLKREPVDDVPAYESIPTDERGADDKQSANQQSAADKEPLLNSTLDSDPIESGCMASSSEEGDEERGHNEGGAEDEESGLSGYESDSNTDIDAIVEEYKERLKVATLDGGVGRSAVSTSSNTQAEPSAATGKRVSMAVSGLLVCSLAVGVAVPFMASGVGVSAVALATASSFVAFLLLALISRQPQTHYEERIGFFRVPLVPWLPGASLILHIGLLLQVLANAWIPFALWAFIGCFLYYWKRGRQRRSESDREISVATNCGSRLGRGGRHHHQHHSHRRLREQVRLRPPPRHSVVSSLIPSHRRAPDESIRRLTQVDTILITR